MIPPRWERDLPDNAGFSVRLRVLGRLDLRDREGRELSGILAQPKRLALLVYLALADPPGFHRRDRLLALFWPEADQELARGALRQALRFLRQALGPELLPGRGDEEVGLAPGAFWCDAAAFEQALAEGKLDEALELYRGPLLDGFFVADSSVEFERWLEDERNRLRGLAAGAAWTLAEREEQAGRGVAAADWARRAVSLSPDDEAALRRLMALLDRLGDKTGALRAYQEFARRLREDFDAEPAAETAALLRSLGHAESKAVPPRPPPESAPPERRRAADLGASPKRRRIAALALGGVALLAAGVLVARALRSAPPAPVVAVGLVSDPGQGDSSSLARTVPELLATDLARIPGLRVVSHARLYEMLSGLGTSELTRGSVGQAARRAGAGELLEGALVRGPGDTLRLELRRVDLTTGVVRKGYSLEGAGPFALADRATAALARDFGLPAPAERLADVTATSLVARRFYEEGLRTYYALRDYRAAFRLFDAALAEDSSFAMAAYYAGESAFDFDPKLGLEELTRAVRLTSRVNDRERLLIRQAWALSTNDPSQLALADTLVIRYPGEPDAEYAAGLALIASGDFPNAGRHLRRAIGADSQSLRVSAARCLACDAYLQTVLAYALADSLPAAERAAREWAAAAPSAGTPWVVLSWILGREQRYPDALAALRRAAERQPEVNRQTPADLAGLALQVDDFPVADRVLRQQSGVSGVAAEQELLWWVIISDRNQGRLGDALVAARRYRRLGTGQPEDRIPQAQVLLELGRHRDAAAQFDSLATLPGEQDRLAPGLLARRKAWMLTHAGCAAAASGDTTRLARLADSIGHWGARSAYGRDARLSSYMQALLLQARGKPSEAEAAFRRSFYSLSDGYTRSNYQLAQLLLAEHKPAEAIAVLEPALRGPTVASNYYITRTELHELLGQAFEAAGARDSAVAQYRVVADAWKAGDPPFRARAAAARHKVLTLGG